MIEARNRHTATVLPDGKVLVAGGHGSSGGLLASAELYDPRSGSWTATGGMIEARLDYTATLLPDGKVLVSGGSGDVTGISNPLASAELYDPSSGSWTNTGNMDGVRSDHTATLLPDGKVLVAGGYVRIGESDISWLASAELYDPGSGSWTVTGSMMSSRARHTATLLPDGKVLVAGGYIGATSEDQLASAELYDPRSGSWTATAGMTDAREGHSATLLPDGKVLVAGGISSHTSRQLASVELYDPSTGSWTATGGMIEARYVHAATLLPDGKVLVAGGYSSSSDALAFAELYDPSTGSWTATGGMIEARYSHTATLLPDGKVLVAGGSDGSTAALASAELYDPGGGN
jgi:WD40 repeat protein